MRWEPVGGVNQEAIYIQDAREVQLEKCSDLFCHSR